MMEKKLIENFLKSDVDGELKQLEDDIEFFKRQTSREEISEQANAGLAEAQSAYINLSKMRVVVRRALTISTPDCKKIIEARYKKGIAEKWDIVVKETGIGKTKAIKLYSEFIDKISAIVQDMK